MQTIKEKLDKSKDESTTGQKQEVTQGGQELTGRG